MNIIAFPPTLNDCQQEQPQEQPDDPVGQAIAALTSAADHLARMAVDPIHIDRMANQTDYEIVRQAMSMTMFISERIDVRMTANAEID